MASIKQYAQEVFRELNERTSKNKFESFLKELNKLIDEQKAKDNANDVGCALSNNCSMNGCYRYFCCTFPNKKV